MSGESIKLVKVEQVELRQLQNRNRVKSSNPEPQKQVEAVKQKARQEFQQQLGVIAQRTQRQEQQTRQLKTSLANLEKNTNQRLQQQQQQLQATVNAASRQQQPLQPHIVQTQAQQFNQIVTQERQERQQQVQVLQQQLQQMTSNINEQKQQHQKLAQDLLADLQTIYANINQNYQHQRFAPGRQAAINRQIEMIRANIQAGVIEAAIANAQQTYLSLSDLRLELEQKEIELRFSALERNYVPNKLPLNLSLTTY